MARPGFLCLAAAVSAAVAACGAGDSVDRAVANDNREPAGLLKHGVLELALDLVEGRWYPEAEDGPAEVVQLFAVRGGPPRVPGPLVRVPAGTRIRASIRNTLPGPDLVLHGLHSRPGSPEDTTVVPAGATRVVEFEAGEPGTCFYWGRTTPGHPAFGVVTPPSSLERRRGVDSQLHGAFIVDPPAGSPDAQAEPVAPQDRVFVIGQWHDPGVPDGPDARLVRDMFVINGRSWPYTERVTAGVGDTLRWRWVNPTGVAHPMHLHGFYFDVTSRGAWAADTIYDVPARRPAVTELMMPGGTLSLEWIATEPGNWLMHCHFADHVSHFLSFHEVPDPEDPLIDDAVDHSIHGMRGLVLGIVVRPSSTAEERPEIYGEGARQIRLLAQAAPRRYGEADGLGFLVHEAGPEPAPDSVPVLSDPLILRRGEPVNITVVNRLRAPTSVHWHGMELPSWSDGVPGWSGMDGRVAPLIMPGDSFVAAFTPPRSGTFIYHSHSNEFYQITSGLYGALIVVDDEHDDARDRTFVIGGNGMDFMQGRVNGRLQPDPVAVTAGETYRLRLINIFPDWRVWVSITGPGRVQEWRPVAKAGADLPPSQAVRGPARIRLGTGEAADFELTPEASGTLALEVVTDLEGWSVTVPIVVRRRGEEGG
jgi:manganese oxidase